MSANLDMEAGLFSSLNIVRAVRYGILDKYVKMIYICCWDFYTKV
jgi:hypothetical protein